MQRQEIKYHAKQEVFNQAEAALHSIYIKSCQGSYTVKEAQLVEDEIKRQLTRIHSFLGLPEKLLPKYNFTYPLPSDRKP